MARILRTAIFAALLIGLLVYLYSIFESSSAVLERQVSAKLGKYLRVTPAVSGVRQPWMGALTIGRIVIPSSPLIEAPHLLTLEGVEIESAVDDWSGVGILPRRPSGSLEISVARAGLTVEFARSSEADPEGDRTRSNCATVLGDWSVLAEAAGEGHRVTVARLDLEVRATRREKPAWRATIEDAHVMGGPDGQLLLEGDLAPGPYWSAGHLQLRFPGGGGSAPPPAIVRGVLDDLRGLDEGLALLFPCHRRFQKLLSPQGPVELTLDDCALLPAEAAGDRRGQAAARYYDTTLRLPPWNLEVRHTSGTVVFDRESIRFGGGREPPLTAEIWGSEVQLRGTIGLTDARIEVHLPPAELAGAFPGSLSRALASLWARLRPSGFLEGDLLLEAGPSDVEKWSGDFAFRDLASEDLLALGPFSGKLTLRSTGSGGQGQLLITSGRAEPFGRLQGEVPFVWTDEGLTLKPVLAPGNGSLSGTITATASALSGSLNWERSTLDFAGGLLRVARSRGTIELSPKAAQGETVSSPPAVPSTPVPEGKVSEGTVSAALEQITLLVDRLPRGDLSLGDGVKLEFAQGSLSAKLTSEGLTPLHLRLEGEGCGMRLLGAIDRRGDLEALLVLAVGEQAQALNALDFPSPPSRWRAAVAGRALPLRLRADFRSCQARRVEWSDPSFRP